MAGFEPNKTLQVLIDPGVHQIELETNAEGRVIVPKDIFRYVRYDYDNEPINSFEIAVLYNGQTVMTGDGYLLNECTLMDIDDDLFAMTDDEDEDLCNGIYSLSKWKDFVDLKEFITRNNEMLLRPALLHIVDFCVQPEFRNSDLGTAIFQNLHLFFSNKYDVYVRYITTTVVPQFIADTTKTEMKKIMMHTLEKAGFQRIPNKVSTRPVYVKTIDYKDYLLKG